MTQAAPGHPLDGCRVVDLGEGIGPAYCTKLLADAGAEVVKLETPAGDRLRRHGQDDFDHPVPPGGDSPLFQALSASKHSLVVDRPEQLDEQLAAADLVVAALPNPLLERLGRTVEDLRAGAPAAAVAALTPYGLDGPWRDLPASDLVLQAWAGGIGARGRPELPPLSVGGELGAWSSGMLAALGLLTARRRIARSGGGELVDVAELETLMFTLTMYPVTYVTMSGGRPWHAVRSTNIPGIEPAQDGWVGFMTVTRDQWHGFCLLVEHPEWIEQDELTTYVGRRARRDELVAAIRAWTSQHPAEEIVATASELRVPAAVVGSGETVADFDHFRDQHWFVRNPSGGFLQPDVPYRLRKGAGRRPLGPSPTLGAGAPPAPARPARAPSTAATSATLEGLRVLDLTAFWAGPVVGHYLAIHGAEVVHVESPTRLDNMRGHSVRPADHDRWWEYSPPFQATNTNKRGLAVDLSSPAGRELFLRLAAQADVVCENMTPRVLERFDLGYDVLRRVRPDIVLLRMPAFGTAGPWRDRGGFAQTMEQISGLAWRTGYPEHQPEIPNGPCDPLAGSHATIALHLALEHRDRTGEGMEVEVAMVGGALNVAAEQVVDFTARGHRIDRLGNRSRSQAPQGVYPLGPAERDEWAALSIESDAQWQALCAELGEPGWANEPRFATAAARHAAHDEIDARITDWLAGLDRDAVVALFTAGRFPIAPVLMPHEQAGVPQLAARAVFEEVSHPLAGAALFAKHPVRLASGPATHNRAPAPTVGGDNRDLLQRWTGCSDEQIARFEADGVIGTRPAAQIHAR